MKRTRNDAHSDGINLDGLDAVDVWVTRPPQDAHLAADDLKAVLAHAVARQALARDLDEGARVEREVDGREGAATESARVDEVRADAVRSVVLGGRGSGGRRRGGVEVAEELTSDPARSV